MPWFSLKKTTILVVVGKSIDFTELYNAMWYNAITEL